MARKTRIDVVGSVHHVMARGLNKQVLFREDVDRRAYLERVEETLAWGKAGCLSWALMPNHAHFVLQQGRASLSAVMHRINSWYAQYFNRRYGRTDSLFGGRPKMKLVDEEEYLEELVRYVHLNPVKANLVTLGGLERWPWTGHAALMGKAKARFLLADEVLGYFGDTAGAARAALAGWMEAGLKPGSSAELIARLESRGTVGRREKGDVDSRILGDATFADRMLAGLDEEDARRVRLLAQGWTPERILERVCSALEVDSSRVRAGGRRRIESTCRAIIAWLACTELEASIADIARLTGIGGTALAAAKARGEGLATTYGLHRLEDLPEPPSTEAHGESQAPSARPGLDAILIASAVVFGLTPADLRSISRTAKFAQARQLFCQAAMNEFGYPGPEVASAIGRHRSRATAYAREPMEPAKMAALRALLPE